MLNVLLVAAGWALIALVVLDVFQTVLWSGAGGGPLTTRVTNVFRGAITRLARRRRKVMSALGPVALLVIVGTWAVLLVIGFTLTLQMDPDAVVSSATRSPADWFERAYVVGYAIFTLGNGDYLPASDLMRAMFVVMSATGLFLMTLSVTYLLPVISASVGARSFASSILSLGGSAAEAVVEAWDGQQVRLDHQLRQWDQQLSTLGQQHLAYPVLHLFHSVDPQASAPAAVVRVDEMLTLLDAVEPTVAPPPPERRQLRSSIERYVSTYGAPVDRGGRRRRHRISRSCGPPASRCASRNRTSSRWSMRWTAIGAGCTRSPITPHLTNGERCVRRRLLLTGSGSWWSAGQVERIWAKGARR